MRVKFWGVRGSIPSSLMTEAWAEHFKTLMSEFLSAGNSRADQINDFVTKKTLPAIGGFGTATTCVEIIDGTQSLIIDGGSGIKNLNDALLKSGDLARINEFHILMSHFHFDHIMGIPFFIPHFMKGKKINYYSVQTETESIVRSMFAKPTFPVKFESLQAEIKFHTLQPYQVKSISGFNVTAYKLDHPDPCYGFRVEKNNKVYAHAIDHEAERVSAKDLGQDGPLFQNANVLYFDAQYDEKEMVQKKGWGHGTYDRGFQVSANFNVQQILFAHHDPSSDLETLFNHKKEAEIVLRAKFPQLFENPNFKWDYAFEGQEIIL